jgi:hypothetical protein
MISTDNLSIGLLLYMRFNRYYETIDALSKYAINLKSVKGLTQSIYLVQTLSDLRNSYNWEGWRKSNFAQIEPEYTYGYTYTYI